MIAFRSSINIRRRPEAIFDFLANLHLVQQPENSPVLALELTTSGPPGVGSQYREVVQMMPFFKGEFISTVTAFEPPVLLEMVWTGPAMSGRDRYDLAETQGGTTLVHHRWLSCPGLLRVMEPLVRRPLFPRLEARLHDIKGHLEEGLDTAEVEKQLLHP